MIFFGLGDPKHRLSMRANRVLETTKKKVMIYSLYPCDQACLNKDLWLKFFPMGAS